MGSRRERYVEVLMFHDHETCKDCRDPPPCDTVTFAEAMATENDGTYKSVGVVVVG